MSTGDLIGYGVGNSKLLIDDEIDYPGVSTITYPNIDGSTFREIIVRARIRTDYGTPTKSIFWLRGNNNATPGVYRWSQHRNIRGSGNVNYHDTVYSGTTATTFNVEAPGVFYFHEFDITMRITNRVEPRTNYMFKQITSFSIYHADGTTDGDLTTSGTYRNVSDELESLTFGVNSGKMWGWIKVVGISD